jgi:hypothetical protein
MLDTLSVRRSLYLGAWVYLSSFLLDYQIVDWKRRNQTHFEFLISLALLPNNLNLNQVIFSTSLWSSFKLLRDHQLLRSNLQSYRRSIKPVRNVFERYVWDFQGSLIFAEHKKYWTRSSSTRSSFIKPKHSGRINLIFRKKWDFWKFIIR